MPEELSLAEVRERQLALLAGLASYCREHDLRLLLCAGTLLGAVRHAGYVPWDDDVDVMLPRADYERLCASYPSTEESSLRVLGRSPGYALPYAKLCDDRTRLEVESDVVAGLGVYVDVFPLDGWRPGAAGRRQAFVLARLLDAMRVKHLTRGRNPLRNVVLLVAKVLLAWLPATTVARGLDRAARGVEPGDATEAGVIAWGYQEHVPARAYDETTPLAFEGATYDGPGDPDTVLRVLYGDYHRLPPEAERVTHHRFTAYLR